MKKKSVIARVGVMAAALTLATTSLMSGTLAKYTTEVSGVATAVVAKWSPSLLTSTTATGNPTTALEQDFTISLNKMLTKYQGSTLALITGADQNSTHYQLAPGVEGTIPIKIDMGADLGVDTVYQVEIAPHDTTADDPAGTADAAAMALRIPSQLKFSYTSSKGTDEINFTTGDPVTVAKGVIPNATKVTKLGGTAATNKKLEINFAWPFETEAKANPSDATGSKDLGNKNDTEYITTDNAAAEDIKLDVIVKVWQASEDEQYTAENAGWLNPRA